MRAFLLQLRREGSVVGNSLRKASATKRFKRASRALQTHSAGVNGSTTVKCSKTRSAHSYFPQAGN